MLTTESLISIISFAVAMFSFGYVFGSNSKNTKKITAYSPVCTVIFNQNIFGS